MKFWLNVILIVLLPTSLMAQRVSYAPTAKNTKNAFTKILVQNEKGFLVLKSSQSFDSYVQQVQPTGNSRNALIFYSKAMNEVWNKELRLPALEYSIQNIVAIGAKIQIFYTSINRNTQNLDLLSLGVDINTGVADELPNLISEQPAPKRRQNLDIIIFVPKDTSAVAVITKAADQQVPDNIRFTVKILNKNLTLLYQKDILTAYNARTFGLKDIALDAKNNLYLLCYDAPSKANEDIKYWFSKINSTDDNIKELKIESNSEVILDALITINEKDSLLRITGFYAFKGQKNATGIAYASVNIQNFELVSKKYTAFKPKFLTQFIGDKQNGSSVELLNYYVDRLIPRSDGGMLLIAESSFINESSQYNTYYQMYTTTYNFHYENVLVFSINADGTMDWECVLRKNQESENDNAFYSSYSVNVEADNVYLIYNKNIRRRSEIVAFRINPFGEYQERTIINADNDVIIMAKGAKQMDNNEIIIPCLQRTVPTFVKLTFD